MKKIIPILFIALLLNCFSFSLFAQADAGFIYGKITTFDDEVFEGQIRWGKEEAYWSDMFNASKVSNENIEFLSDNELRDLEANKSRRYGWTKKRDNFWDKWDKEEPEYEYIHQFSCQFGDLKQVNLKRYKRIELTMKDDSKIRVSGDGYNDIGADIMIYDKDRGRKKIEWDEILVIDFLPNPREFQSVWGAPLYGTVKTRKGIFVGQVQWDKDERIASDVLDGRNREGKHKIEFSEIRAIEKEGDGCLVEFKNGEDDYLSDSNDVDHGNRGVIVTNPAFGRVVIDWKDFRRVDFTEPTEANLMTYNDFQAPLPIKGTIQTKSGQSIYGKIVYDLDESFQYELLNGEKGRLQFEIPFRNIQRIIPARDESTIELKSGSEKLILEDSQDITQYNEGILVFDQSDKPTYISWREIKEIVLD